ncbi:MAG: hypothetical protein HY276_03160 [Ignavibacteriales bacterium]|nr:hypothetical protein [Ignavibacteriales bacterium]
MGIHLGSAGSLREFQEAVFNGRDIDGERIEITARPDQFKIPPKELEEMLPQQLLMLQVAAAALDDAGGLKEEALDRTGVFIGAQLDLNTTNYSLRWTATERAKRLNNELKLALDESQLAQLADSIREAAGPPLTANRTVGGLGGMIASRVSREWRIGGPSFTITSEDTTVFHGIQIAAELLRRGEIDCAIAGAVEFGRDTRSTAAEKEIRRGTDCDLPAADGAAAMVLKRLSDAKRDEDCIYCLLGESSGAAEASRESRAKARSELSKVPRNPPPEGGGKQEPAKGRLKSGEMAAEGNNEVEISGTAMGFPNPPRVIKRTMFAGCLGGMASVVKGATCLYQEMLPRAGERARYWLRDRIAGPRKVEVSCPGIGGDQEGLVLEECIDHSHLGEDQRRMIESERRNPLGGQDEAVLVLFGDDPEEIQKRLREFRAWVEQESALTSPAETIARRWWRREREHRDRKLALAITAKSGAELIERASIAEKMIRENPSRRIDGLNQIFYSPQPLGAGRKEN